MTLHTYNPPTNVPAKYQLPTPHSFRDIAQQDFQTQGHYSKVKGQMKVTPWHCIPTTPTNAPTRYQLPTPYGFQDIARTRFYRSRSLRQGQRSNQGHTNDVAHLDLLTNVPTNYQLPTPYSFRDIARTRFDYVKVTTARSKVKSRSHHDVTHLHSLTNVSTKYQLPTPYSFWDIARTRFSNSRSLRQGQIKVRPWHCTPTPPSQCPYQVSTSYTLRFLRYSPDKLFPPPVRPSGHHGWKQYPTAL